MLQFLQLLINFITVFANVIIYAIIARILFSWFKMGNPGVNSRLEQVLIDVTEPVINLARKIPHRAGMLDFAPVIAILGVDLLSQLIIQIIIGLAS